MTLNFAPSPRGIRRASDRAVRHRAWLAVTGLILLSLIPVIAGMLRLSQLTLGAPITPESVRFVASPVPVIAHILGATVYSLLGAFQFVPALRSKRSWHRVAGLALIPAGFVTALSGLWMAVFYSSSTGDGGLLMVARLVFGSAMVASLVVGVCALMRRDFAAHGPWMTRAYAIGVAAGTQALILGAWIIFIGPLDGLTNALLHGAAWVINASAAEFLVVRRARRPLA
ncbi:DUF2306 domain-containing protein [Ruicaihuangia caeni]|uniref:DUF2306 domain-containing protein n=1 Tax=Ruicaihuangia caeni TaxID=3042517 RepID=UPI0033904AA5